MRFINGEWVADANSAEAVSLSNIAKRQQKIDAKKSEKSEPAAPVDIRQQNMQVPEYRFAYVLAEHIVEQLGLEQFNKIIFRNTQRYYYLHNSKTIVLGYSAVNDRARRGYTEYKTVAPVWFKNNINPESLFGKKAVWAMVLHEMAHHIDQMDNGVQFSMGHGRRARQIHHGETYRQTLNTLIELFPYDEVENI